MMKFLLFILSIQVVALASDRNPLFKKQWYLKNTGQNDYFREEELILREQPGIPGNDINWISSEQSKNETIIAIIDSGIDTTHPDLQGRIVEGKNFLHEEDSVQDDTGHGTHVAGLIAANDNDLGIVGVTGKNSNIKIMPLKVLSQATKSFSYNKKLITEYFADAINYAIDKKVAAINMSVGFPLLVLTENFIKAIKRASKNEIPIIVAAGNNNKDLPVYPCSFNEVICVGAIDNQGNVTSFSNYGNRVDVLAPGRNMISTYPLSIESEVLRLNGYEIKRGTSQAAPLVTGVIGVLKNQQPSLTLNQIKARIFATSKTENQKYKHSLFGMIDMASALNYKSRNIFYPQTKEIDQIVVNNKDLSFEIKLPITKLDGSAERLKLNILPNKMLSFGQLSYDLDYQKQNLDSVIIKAKLNNVHQDHLIPIKIKIEAKDFEHTFTINLRVALATKVLQEINITLDNVIPDHIARFEGRKTSFLNYVFSTNGSLENPEYFYIDRDTTRNKIVDIIHLSVKNGKSYQKRISLPRDRRVIALLKGDYNLDKKDDYLLLVREIDQRHTYFYLYYFDNNFKPLWEKSIFKLDPTKSYFSLGQESLLEFDKGLPTFTFIKYLHNDLGQIMVPVVTKQGLLPEEDNSNDIFDYEPVSIKSRNYLLIPDTNTGLLNQRVVLSVPRRIEIEQELKLNPLDNLRFEGFLKENPLNTGVTKALISHGYGLARSYKILKLENSQEYKLENLVIPENIVLAANNIFNSFGAYNFQAQTLFFSLYEGSKARATYLHSSGKYYNQNLISENYNDPFMGFIGSIYNEKEFTSWLESRYHVYAFKNSERFKIAINRESSFPGVEFSETMENVSIKNEDKFSQGVFVNSVLLYGDQLYSISLLENKLSRPISLTVQIPDNCAYMKPSRYNDSRFDHYIFVCLDEKKKAYLKLVPLIQ